MEENEKVLFDYLYIIWKRKVFIIVVTLVGIVIGVVMSLRLVETYRAEAVVRIGQGVTTTIPTLLDEPKNLATTIPIEYAREIGTGYSVRVEEYKGTPLVKVIVEGSEVSKAGEYLKKILEKLVKDHRKLTEQRIESYRVLAKGIGEYIEVVGNQMTQFALLEEKVDVEGIDSAAENGIMDGLWSKRMNLVALQREAEYKIYVNSLRTNMTTVIGEIGTVEVPVSLKKAKYAIFAGVLGLTISIFLILFMEYLRGAREEGRWKREDGRRHGNHR